MARIGPWAAALLAILMTAPSARAQSAMDDAALRGTADDLPPPDTDLPPRPALPPALPPLAPYPGSHVQTPRNAPAQAPGPTVAALPPPPPRRVVRSESNPFDPLGVMVGDLKLTPYVEQDVGYATNPLGGASAKGSALTTTSIGVGLASNWSRNELRGSLQMGYSDYPGLRGANTPSGTGTVNYRLDASRDLSFDAEGRYSISSQTNAQLGLTAAATNSNTVLSTYGATLGATQQLGRFSLGLHGSIDRTQYAGGGLAGDDYDEYGLSLRAGYRASEAFMPFIEAEADTRRYDAAQDRQGYWRDSDGYAAKTGVSVQFTHVLTGEVSAGYAQRGYSDLRLGKTSAPTVDATLNWSVTPLTSVTLRTASTLRDSLIVGSSADINRSYTVSVAHDLTRRMTLGASAGFTTDNYIGVSQNSRTINLGASAEYHLSREVVLRASASRQQITPNIGAGYQSDTFLLGVRLQK